MFSIVLLKNKNKLFLQIVFLLHIFVLLQTMSSYCFQHWIGYICAVTDLTRALVTLHIPSPSFFTPCIHRAFYAVQYRTLCIVQTSLSPSCFTPTMAIGHSIIDRAFYAVHCTLCIVETSPCSAGCKWNVCLLIRYYWLWNYKTSKVQRPSPLWGATYQPTCLPAPHNY